MSEVMLRVENLKKSFDGRVVLDGIDLQVHQGEVVAVIGPSGTGKSTLLRCIDLLELPDEGSITIGEVAVQAPGISRRQQYQLRAQTAMVLSAIQPVCQQDGAAEHHRAADPGQEDAQGGGPAEGARGAEAGGAGGQGGRLSLPPVRRAAAAGVGIGRAIATRGRS